MRISDMNWMQVRDHVAKDDRAVLPIGSTEQHAYLSLSVDSILAERVASESAQPLGVPVFPTLNYGLTPAFVDYPGTVSLRLSTLCALLVDVLDGIVRSGFRRIVIVNGHGGNSPAHGAVLEWLDHHRGVQVKWHNWWNAPRTFAEVQRIDPIASHASWMENFPWTRLAGVAMPDERKPMLDMGSFQQVDPGRKKDLLGDGNYGGLYQRPDEEMLAIWRVAIEETRALIDGGWHR
ncbi:MAG TPA: creatininase family protein [Beijerinckiaceae bacterium]|nr:creatininase family protein [Beijerinckiaceae bacterium]